MSTAHSPPTRVARTSPQFEPSRLVFVGDTLAVLGPTTCRLGELEVPVENPKGLAAIGGQLVLLDAPASAPGQVRLRRFTAAGELVGAHVGALTVPFAGRALVLAGRTGAELVVVSWESRGAISRLSLTADGFVLEDFTPFSPTGPAVWAEVGDAAWIRVDGDRLVHRAADGAETSSAAPGLVGATHLVATGGDGVAAFPDGSLAAFPLSDATRLAPRAATGATVLHLAARGEVVAALLLVEDPTVQRRELTLARFAPGGGGWSWRVPVPGVVPPTDLWVAVSDTQVAVGGSRGASTFGLDGGVR